jgi:hypothetical protein
LGHTLDAGDRALTVLAVLQPDAVGPVHTLALSREAIDVALGVQDLQHRLVLLGDGHDEVVLVRQVRVADPCEQIRHRDR